MSFSSFNIYPTLTPVKALSVNSVGGVYVNGPTNNGVGATITNTSFNPVIDSVTIMDGDRIAVAATDSTANQNGIYDVNLLGPTSAILTRSADFQNVEQMIGGQNFCVALGNKYGGSFVSLPTVPNRLGIDALLFNIGANNTTSLGAGFLEGLIVQTDNETLINVSEGTAVSSDDVGIPGIVLPFPNAGNFPITNHGVNGLDTGSLAGNTPYAVYIIGDSTAKNPVAFLFSLNWISPLLPSGYDSGRRIGSFITNPGATATRYTRYQTSFQPNSTYRLVNIDPIPLGTTVGGDFYTTISVAPVLGTAVNNGPAAAVIVNVSVTLAATQSDNIFISSGGDASTIPNTGYRFTTWVATGTEVASFTSPAVNTTFIGSQNSIRCASVNPAAVACVGFYDIL